MSSQDANSKKSVSLAVVGAIFLAALAVRLIYFVQVRHCPLFQYPTIDARDYYNLAVHFGHNDWLYPQQKAYWQPPFYPIILGLWMHIFGLGIFRMKLVQLIIGAINCALVYLLGAKVFDKRIGLIAGIAACFYGPMIYFDGELLTPTVQTFFILCSLLLLFSATEKRSLSLTAAAGLIFGCALLTRPDVAIFLPVAVIWTFLFLRKSTSNGKLLAMCAVLVLCSILPIVPIAVRNFTVGKDKVIISTNGGINFYIGNNENAQKTEDIRPGPQWEELVAIPEMTPDSTLGEQDHYFYSKAFSFIKSHPVMFIQLQLKKLGQYFTAIERRRNHDLYFYRTYSSLYSTLIFKLGTFAFPFGIIFPIAVFGLLRMKWDRRSRLLLLFLACQCLATVAFFVMSRYRVTSIPILLLFAAFGAVELWSILKSKKWEQARWPAIIATFALIFTNLNLYHLDINQRKIDAESHYYIGYIYKAKHNDKDAITEFKKSIALDTKLQDSHMYYAFELDRTGHRNQAAKEAHFGLRLFPTAQKANEICGIVDMDAGDLWGAFHCFQTSTLIDPWACPYLEHLGDVALKRGDVRLFIKSYELIAALKPDDQEAQEKVRTIHTTFDEVMRGMRANGKRI